MTKQTMKRREIKERAQDAILDAAMLATYRAREDGEPTEVVEEIDRQLERLERLFGYGSQSWGRGC